MLGNAITGEESFYGGKLQSRSERLSLLLYGNRDGRIGIVSRLNTYLRFETLDASDKNTSVNLCWTQLNATKEAVRKNWEYLRSVNLNATDLSHAALYEADLANSVFTDTDLESTICGAPIWQARLSQETRTSIRLRSNTQTSIGSSPRRMY